MPRAVVGLLLVIAGCSSLPQSTRLTAGDFSVTTEAMVQSLRNSAFLASRGPDSTPIVIVIDRVENRTSDILSTAEQWMYVAKVANSLPLTTLGKQKNIRYVITPERYAMLRRAGFDGDLGSGLTPTHLMSATFISSARAARTGRDRITNLRSDYYYLEYTITDINSRQIVWQDQFEFQRQASGRIID